MSDRYFVECHTTHGMTFVYLGSDPTVCPIDGCDDFSFRIEEGEE